MSFRRNVSLLGALLLVACGATAQSPARKTDTPDLKEIRDYRLNMDVIQKYIRAVKTGTNDPAAKKCFENKSPGNAPTIDAGEKIINTCPAAVADLAAAGLKPREFIVITGALIGDFMAVSMKKNGAIKEYPATISPENAAFIEQNYDKIQAMLTPLTGDGK